MTSRLDDFPRVPLMFGPSPVHPLPRLSAALGGKVEVWAKREDCNSGIAFGGNKVRKLEYVVADAIAKGRDTLVSIGGIQSNHTRAVTGVARHLGLNVVTHRPLGFQHWHPRQLAACARLGRSRRRQALSHSRWGIRPSARWPWFRQLGA
jgi:hypothetical protein